MHVSPRFGLPTLVLGFLIAIVAAPSTALGQTTATLAGVVEDATGGRLPGVAISLTAGATNVVRTTQTDAAGRFVIAGLPAGEYNLRASPGRIRCVHARRPQADGGRAVRRCDHHAGGGH